MAGNIWTTLGIAATDDRKAIRKAYAARLKQIDVETEAQKFIELREAMDGALHLIQMAVWEKQQEELEQSQSVDESAQLPHDSIGSSLPDLDAPDQNDEDAPVEIVANEQSDAEEEIWAEGQKLYNQIIDIITSEQDPPEFLTDEEEELLVPHTQAFFDWLDRSPISAAQAYEHELAYALAYTVPRSDSLLQPSVNHFGWDRTGQEWDRDPVISEILSRLEGNRALSALIEPDHKWHQAYLELTGQAQKRQFWQPAPKQQIRELIATVKAKYPSVETALDPEALGKWERKLDVGSQGFGAFLSENRWLVIVVIIAISTCARVVDTNDRDFSVAPAIEANYPDFSLSERDTDIGITLQQYFGPHLTVADLQTKNVMLLRKLGTMWDEAKSADNDILRFRKEFGTAIDNELNLAIPQADSTELSAYWKVRADIARHFKQSIPLSCSLFLSGELKNSPVPEHLRSRLQEALANILAGGYEEGRVNSAARSFSISAPMLTEIATRTKLPQNKVVEALQGGGTADDQCLSRLTLIDIVSESGTHESLEIMRSM